MALRQPTAIYTASKNFEAHLVCGLLNDAGIPAMVVEDSAMLPYGWLGPVENFIKPKVWIEKTDVARAVPILEEYEKRDSERRAIENGKLISEGEPIDVVCEDCGKTSRWPAVQKGSVQNCPNCRAYIDIGDDLDFDDWKTTAEDDE